MTVKELCEYLSGFNPDAHIGVVAVELEARQAYKPTHYQLMTGAGFPVLLIEIGNPAPLDDVLEVTEDEP